MEIDVSILLGVTMEVQPTSQGWEPASDMILLGLDPY